MVLMFVVFAAVRLFPVVGFRIITGTLSPLEDPPITGI